MDRKLHLSLDTGSLADKYVQARKPTQDGKPSVEKKSSTCHICGKTGYATRECWFKHQEGPRKGEGDKPKNGKEALKCYS